MRGPQEHAVASPASAAPVVPYIDLRRINAPLVDGIGAALARAMGHGRFLGGEEVEDFERAFADYCGAAESVGVACGLDALRFALIGAGIEPGDEVIVPANTFVDMMEAVVQAGATPRLADVSERDYNIDPAHAAALVSRRTRAIVAVHLYGQMADMDALSRIARRHDLALIEDAAQAHGADRAGRRAGAASQAAAFSFYPTKNLGAMGDAGAVVTSSPSLAATARMLRDHGQRAKHQHVVRGWTSRLDTFQAVVLLQRLPWLDEHNAQRRLIARWYASALDGLGDLVLPPVAPGSRPVWHVYPVATADPAALGRHLSARGVETSRHYPVPVHLSEGWRDLRPPPGALPVTERLASRLLSLPCFPGMTEGELERVAAAIRSYFDG